MPSKPQPFKKESIVALGEPRKTWRQAAGLGESTKVIGQGVAREVVDVLTKRSIPSTAAERIALIEEMKKANGLVSRVGTRVELNRSLARIEILAHNTQVVFQEALRKAARHKKFFGEVPNGTVQDLLLTFEALLNSQRFVKTQRQRQQQQQQTAPQPAPPAPPSPVTAPQSPPQPAPAPVKPKTPEQERQEEELKKLEEELRRSKEHHQKQHQAFDPVMEKLKELMRQMGAQAGLNDFDPPKQPGFPPQHRKEFSPSMDERKVLKEGQEAPPPWFTVEPPLRGYFRQTIFDSFDKKSVTWREDNTEIAYPMIPVPHQHTLRGSIEGKIALPLPAGYLINYASLEPASSIKATYDEEHGVTYLESSKPQTFSVAFGKHNVATTGKVKMPAAYHTEDIITGDLSIATTAKLASVAGLPPEERAKNLAEYVQEFLDYSNDSTFNFIYKSSPETYFQKIEEFKKADCDVANTYFVALCRRAGIPARLVAGHSVAGAKNGKAEMGSGTGHAWAEIWDGSAWQTIDAQPEPEKDDEEEGAGEALDKSCKEEKTDLQQNKPKSKPKPHKKAKQFEKKLKEAKEKNDKQALTDQEMAELKEEMDGQDGVKETQKQEIQKSVQANADLMEDEADTLEKNGRKEDADALRKKLKPVEQALAELKGKPEDSQAREELKRVLDEANRQAIERGFQEFYRMQFRLMQQRVAALADEEETDAAGGPASPKK